MVTDESGIPPPYDDVIKESTNLDAEDVEGQDEVDKFKRQNSEGAQEKNVSFA